MAIATAEHCLRVAPNDAAYDAALDRARTLTKAIAGDHGSVPAQRWSGLCRVWATLIRYVGDAAVLREFGASPGDWSQKCLRPLDVETRRFVKSALATQQVDVALEVATACLEVLRPRQRRPLAGPRRVGAAACRRGMRGDGRHLVRQ
jgi:hypothetical protein